MITVLSLGAGVQSSCVLLLAERGEIERPVEAIFADTGWEPSTVYDHLAYLRTQTSIPISIVTAGNLRDDVLASKTRAWMPLYAKNLEGGDGMLRRQCTTNYKITPIRRRMRELMSLHGTKRVRQQFGISLDEAVKRMRQSDVKYIDNAYPLVDLRMSREDCLRWLERNGYRKPPKSACIGCPYHDGAHWRTMKRERPEDFANAVSFDAAIRHQRGDRFEMFVHRDRVPLGEVDLRTEEDHGQLSFLAECLGMCGI